MQRDGNSDDRTKTGASGRTPPVIEGEAVDVSAPAAGAAPVEAAVAEPGVESETPAAEAADTHGAGPDAIAAPPVKKRRGCASAFFVIFGILIVAVAGAIAWIASPGNHAAYDNLKSRAIAILPPSAQRMLHVAPAAGPTPVAAKSAAPAEKAQPGVSPAGDAAKVAAAKTETASSDAPKSDAPKTDAPKSDAPKPEARSDEPGAGQAKAEAPKSAEAQPGAAAPVSPAASGEAKDAVAPGSSAPQSGMTIVGGPPVAIGVDPKRIEDMSVKIDGLQGKLDAALGRIADLQSKLELAQGRIDLAQSKTDATATAKALAEATQRIEALTQKLAAIEQKLEQPKTDARAPQARENSGAPSGRELAASRAVVAQATTEALRAGAPLGDDLAALKGLGVVDDKLTALSAYAKAGAPTVAQLTQQWRGLRDKVVALDAPPPGASFGDKLLARAKGVFHVTWAGQGSQNSIASIAGRVDAALAKNDLAGALAACDEFPAAAKNLVAEWQKAASARLQADAAARALLSESISAIGRSSSQ